MLKRIKQALVEKPVKRIQVAAIGLAAFIFTLSITVVVASAISVYTVTILDMDKTFTVVTRKSEPLEILHQENIVLGANDLLDTTGFIDGKDSTLIIYRACTVKLVDTDISVEITACKNVEHTLALNNITVGVNDRLSMPLDEPVYEGMTIAIDRAFGVTVIADGACTELQMIQGTVLEVLQKAGITLDADDETVPPPATPLAVGMDIKVLRVENVQRTVNETVKFEKTTKKSKDIYIGDTKIVQAGVDGEKTVVYNDRTVDGVSDISTVVSQTVIKEAVPQITLIGTMIKVAQVKFQPGLSPISDLPLPADIKLDANGLPVTYSKIIDGTAKAYSGGGTTATGRPAMEGYIAVDPRQIPYGTRLYVVSLDGKYVYGYCIAADTGGFVQTNGCTIDIYMNTFDACYAWGHRGVRIFVLD